MKVKAKIKNNILKVKALIKHEMMTYDQAQKKLGDANKANFVTHIVASINNTVVYDASTSQFLSTNPIIKFKVHAASFSVGDKLSLTWRDRSGKEKRKKVTIK
jgi:sulfur-oxidizing protein SoxZ